MIRLALFFALPFAIACTANAAELTGIATCDDFLTEYEVCVSEKVPAAQQGEIKSQIEQLRASWQSLAQNPQTKPTLEAVCKTSADQMKIAVASYGCAF